MSRSSVKRHADVVQSLLHSRWPEVRLVAVEALERAEVGVEVLRSAIKRERNDTVLAAVCEALLVLDDAPSIASLKRLARNHVSWLVRRHAAWAVSEISGKRAVPFLKKLLRDERSTRVKATIREALAKHGDLKELESLLDMLRSRDYIVRTSIANFFAVNTKVTRGRDAVARRLREALAIERTRAAASALRNALNSVER